MSNIRKKPIDSSFQEREKGLDIPYQQLFLYLGVVGITVLFIALTVAYLFSSVSWQWAQFRFPKLFLVSAILIVLSSFSIQAARKAYDEDDSQQLYKMLQITLGLSIGFVIAQTVGWNNLYQQGIYVAGKPDGSYLYLISGLHALHVLVGVGILGVMMYGLRKKLNDPVKSLLYFTDPSTRLNLKLLAFYWHFVDILWIYLLLFFLFNHL